MHQVKFGQQKGIIMYVATSLIQAIRWLHMIEVVIIDRSKLIHLLPSSFRVSSTHFNTTFLCPCFLKAKSIVSNPLFHFGVQFELCLASSLNVHATYFKHMIK
jgi:hypothetical protein